MWRIRKSKLFKKQLLEFAENYKERADLKTANRFLDSVDDAMKFVSKSPLACAVYFESQNSETLKEYEFRKWSVKIWFCRINYKNAYFKRADVPASVTRRIYSASA
jgi:hypothetical protein